MDITKMGCGIVLLLACAGCGREYTVERVIKVPKYELVGDDSMIVMSRDGFRQRRIQIDPNSAEFVTAYDLATGNNSADARKGRDQIAFAMMRVSDELCQHHIGQMRSISTNTNLTFGTLTTIFSTGASLVSGQLGQNYAAVAATSNSLRSLFNEEVYRRNLAENIALLIEKIRQEERKNLLSKLGSADVASYSIHRAMYEIDLYHSHCSLIYGLSKAAEAINSAGPALARESSIAGNDTNEETTTSNQESAGAPETTVPTSPDSTSRP